MSAKSVRQLALEEFRNNQDSFCIIDIRGKQAFHATHLRDSINLQTLEEILDFLCSSQVTKPLLLICFSSAKAKQIALKLTKSLSNISATIYQGSVYYLNAGIMEVADNGIPITESQANPYSNTITMGGGGDYLLWSPIP
ncbi:hypothetical protein CCZ01_06150 [Helicobacter monodelphidis]|uniref:rhodanese-like domain-containing protein n=1 Tax=Helicobacter sp. 15-1451 TaxID=2004995 RepID=UPI000DCCAA6E|nr:rhodanese-like domain-containing protein [Helicobacter sp. 15-1451]RAX57416.1 hypothetical protein CCZ01_06150 [Helicobacter sp. 15-1451]